MLKTTRKIILDLANEYLSDETTTMGFIREKWIDKVTKELNLKELNELELANMWDMVYLTLDHAVSYYQINANGYESDISWRERDNYPLKDMTLSETISYLKNKSRDYAKSAMKWEDVKSAFTEVVNLEARRRKNME